MLHGLSRLNSFESYLWGNIPLPNSMPIGTIVMVSDVGNSLWITDGVEWSPVNHVVNLFGSAIPIILPSSGVIGNNGAISGLTALPTTYSNGCYIYLPANAISAGSAAGIYFAIMSSTTAGVVYNNLYTGGAVSVPVTPIPFSTTGPGAYTQTINTDIVLLSYNILGGLLGNSGRVQIETVVAVNNTADTKTWRIRLQNAYNIRSYGITTTGGYVDYVQLRNRGSQLSQVSGSSSGAGQFGQLAAPVSYHAADLLTDTPLTWVGRLSNANSFIVFEMCNATLER